jgi:starch synthase
VSLLRFGYTCHDAFPSTHTNTQQIFWTLFEVAQLGHRVDLCVPAIAGGADARSVIAHHYGASGHQLPEGFDFIPIGRGDGGTMFARAMFDVRAPAALVSRGRQDVVWTRDPLALVSALQRGLPTVFETYRPDYATARVFAPWRAATLRRPGLVGVVAHSALAAAAFVDAGVGGDRVLVAHNGHAPVVMQPELSRDEARAVVGLPNDAPLVVYTGHVGPKKGTDALVALAAALPHVRVVIVGADDVSEERAWLDRCIERAGARNVTVVGRVALQDVASYLYAADCLVIPPTDEPLRRYRRTVLPMKLFSYMAAGRPIFAPALPDIEEVLTDGRTAVLVKPGDPSAAAGVLRELLADNGRCERLSFAARAASREFTWGARAAKIVKAVHRWTAQHDSSGA